MNQNSFRDHSNLGNRQQRLENDSDISSFVCLPNLPDWVIPPHGKETYRTAIERAKAEVDLDFVGI